MCGIIIRVTQQTETYTFSIDDPDVIKYAADYFLSQHKELRERLLSRKSPGERTYEIETLMLAALCVENFPKDSISDTAFKYLLETFYAIDLMLNEIPPKNPSPFIAGLWYTHRAILHYAYLFVCMTLYQLVFDERYNPNQNLVLNKQDYPELPLDGKISRYLDLESLRPDHYKHLRTAARAAKLTELQEKGYNFPILFGETFQILQMTSRIFFNFMQSRYSLSEISACSAIFDAIMIKFGSGDIEAECELYHQKWNEMYEAIRRFEEHGGITNVDAGTLVQLLSYAKETHEKVLALSDSTRTPAPNRRKKRLGHGGKGKRTEKMKEQLSDFQAWMIGKKQPKSIGEARGCATRFWNAHKTKMEKAKNGKDQNKGYEDADCLAQAYWNCFKKRTKPCLT